MEVRNKFSLTCIFFFSCLNFTNKLKINRNKVIGPVWKTYFRPFWSFLFEMVRRNE